MGHALERGGPYRNAAARECCLHLRFDRHGASVGASKPKKLTRISQCRSRAAALAKKLTFGKFSGEHQSAGAQISPRTASQACALPTWASGRLRLRRTQACQSARMVCANGWVTAEVRWCATRCPATNTDRGDAPGLENTNASSSCWCGTPNSADAPSSST